jgi:hypothetical protein
LTISLYRLAAVSADETGNIFVLDAGEPRIVSFDRDGNHLRTFGNHGQGPSELDRPVGV